jgi:hypothetical protein
MNEAPGCFRIVYSDGDRETMDFAELTNYLCDDTDVPAETVPAAWPIAVVSRAGEQGPSTTVLPDQFDLTTKHSVAQAVKMLMPGVWTPQHLTKLSNAFNQGNTQCVETTPSRNTATAPVHASGTDWHHI